MIVEAGGFHFNILFLSDEEMPVASCWLPPGHHLPAGAQLERGHLGRSRQGGARAGNHGRWRSVREAEFVG